MLAVAEEKRTQCLLSVACKVTCLGGCRVAESQHGEPSLLLHVPLSLQVCCICSREVLEEGKQAAAPSGSAQAAAAGGVLGERRR